MTGLSIGLYSIAENQAIGEKHRLSVESRY